MSNANVIAGLEAAGISDYQRRQKYGWTKFAALSGAGAPPQVAQFANQIAEAFIRAGRAEDIEAVFNTSDLNATHPATDTIAKLRRRLEQVTSTPSTKPAKPAGMAGVIAGIPTKPTPPKPRNKPSVTIPYPPPDPRDTGKRP